MATMAQQPAWTAASGSTQLMKPLNNSQPTSDDTIGVLLRIEGAPEEVVLSLLSSGTCNVEGLRRHCANGQDKTTKELGLSNRSLLDGFPSKVREVFIKMGIISTPIQNAAMAQAVTQFSNTGVNPARPNMQNPGGMGPLPMYDETKEGGSWSSPACCVPISSPSEGR